MAENIEEEKYQTSEEFEHPIFGCLEEVSGNGIAKDMQEIGSKSFSSISNFICGIIFKDGLSGFDKKQSPLYDHFVAYNDGDNVIYIRAEIKFDSLKNGEDISNDVLEHFQCYGLPGDIVTQYIPKLLGGYDSGDNSFNLNPTANIKEWKAGLTKCYEHLKKDKKNIVRIIYIIGYQKGEIRPCDIFYNFKLYSNNIEKPDETVEGKFHNPVPKVNHHDGI